MAAATGSRARIAVKPCAHIASNTDLMAVGQDSHQAGVAKSCLFIFFLLSCILCSIDFLMLGLLKCKAYRKNGQDALAESLCVIS